MSEYKDHAYERSAVATIQRILLDRFLQSDTPPKETMVCEEVPRFESEIPQYVLLRILTKLQLWENVERQKMNEFRMVRVSDLPFPDQDTPAPEPKKNEQQAPAPKPARKPRRR
jgi:hypothetical protein